ncbi:MAG TPA: hypothetical protein VKE74_35115 [Gemmataceae bacterium]|nr:hypothetical protein [Gemmataceae bacterium]
MRLVLGLVLVVSGVLARAQDAPTANEKATIAALAKLGGKAAVEPELPKDARVSVKFDTATDATLLALKKHPDIGAIQALDGTRCTEKGFAALNDLPHLRRLVLNRSGVSDKELAVIVGCKELRELVIPASGVTDAGLASLAKLPRLEALDVSENPRITDKGMAQIAMLERLEHLYLGKTSITDKGLFELKPLEGLRTLHVAGTKVSANAAEKFADEMPNLRVVRR